MDERQAAFSVLLKFANHKQRLDDLTMAVLKNTVFNPEQMRFFRQLASGVVRHLYFLDDQIRRLYKGRFNRLDTRVLTLLRMGFYELHFIDGIPHYATLHEYVARTKKIVRKPGAAALVNALLRGFIRAGGAQQPVKKSLTNEALSMQYSFPLWMIKRWSKAWGISQAEALCRAFNRPPKFSIRVNRKKISVEAFVQKAREQNVKLLPSSVSDVHFRVDTVQPFLAAGYFEKGYCSVQDESAAVPIQLLDIKKDSFFLDVCAAPGGKFTQALEDETTPRLAVAVDNDWSRLKKVKKNLSRLGLRADCVLADATRLPFKDGVFDRILIDAPCSGQGVIRKHPDIKWRRSEDEVNDFARLQKSILAGAPRILAENGVLVYSTCSIDPQEDEAVVAEAAGLQVQKINTDKWKALTSENGYIRTFPSLHKMDGSFAAKFTKG